jgi:hypothetical protein
MSRLKRIRRIGHASRALGTLSLVAVLGLAGPAAAQTSSQPGDSWQFSLTPYIWLPNIHGTLNFNTPPGAAGSPTTEVGADDYLKNLDMALMLTGEARKGAWAIFTDVIYLDFSNESAAVRTVSGPGGIVQVPVNAGTQAGLKGLVWELAASYTVSRSNTATVEVLGGFRYLGLEATVNWQLAGSIGLFPQSGSFSQKEDLWDAIVGVRGRVKLGSGNWFVPWYLDAGTGSSALTWQAMAGIGHSFKWGDLLLAYRHLSYDQDNGKLVQDMRFSGPALGATFRF